MIRGFHAVNIALSRKLLSSADWRGSVPFGLIRNISDFQAYLDMA